MAKIALASAGSERPRPGSESIRVNYADAEQLAAREPGDPRESLGHEHSSVARGLFDLATILALRGKNSEAEAAYRESLALRERLWEAGSKDIDSSDRRA